MSIKFKCRKCDSEQLNVWHECAETETGGLCLRCDCDDGEKVELIPPLPIAAEVDYERITESTLEWIFDGEEWFPGITVAASVLEESYSDEVIRCSACHEASHFPSDYETADGPEVEVDENSHRFKISCANCHEPIECVGAIEEFVRQALVG